MTTPATTTRLKAKRIPKTGTKATARAVTGGDTPDVAQRRQDRLQELAERFSRGDSQGRKLTWDAAKAAFLVCDQEKLESQKAFGARVRRTQQIISRYVHAERLRRLVDEDDAKWIHKNLSVTDAATMHKQYNQFSETDKAAIPRRRFVQEVVAQNGNIRKARAALTAEVIKERTKAGLDLVAARDTTAWGARCHHGCYLDLLKRLPDSSVNFVNFDPPYFGYRWKQGKGLYGSSHSAVSGLRIDCANIIPEVDDDAALAEAYRVHFDEAFAQLNRILKPGGLVAVWTRGAHETPGDIRDAALAHGFEIYFAIEWDKADDDAQDHAPTDARPRDAAQAANFSEPHAESSERLVLFKRKDDRVRRADPNTLPRGTIIRPSYVRLSLSLYTQEKGDFWSYSMGSPTASTPGRSFTQDCAANRKSIGVAHQFQKHEEWGLYQLMKYCHPGDVVVDAFGCSASFCIAAEQYGCEWYYAEKNKANFDWAMSRIAEYFEWAARSHRPGHAAHP